MTDSWSSLEGVTFAERFQLQSLLGENGNSARFLTRIDGTDALGWIRLALVAGDGDDRQAQIWQTVAGLSHPNLVEVWETGQGERGVTSMSYLLTEPADDDLAGVLRERPLDQVEARETLLAVVKALGYLHSKGLVHGKLQPPAIVAVGDHIKLSVDSIRPAAQSGDAAPTPAGDLRSLANCVYAMFTQNAETDLEQLAAIPQPFRDIVRGCYEQKPDEQWTAQRVLAALEWPAEPAKPVAAARPVESATPPKSVPQETPRPEFVRRAVADAEDEPKRISGWLVALACIGVALIVILLVRKPQAVNSQSSPEIPASQPAPVSRPAPTPAPAPSSQPSTPTPAQPPPSAIPPVSSRAVKIPKPSPFPALAEAAVPPAKEPSSKETKQATDAEPSRIWRVISYTYSRAEDAVRMVGRLTANSRTCKPNGSFRMKAVRLIL